MSRRDTIIIAVLANVGLLIVLFATAVSHEGSSEKKITSEPSITFNNEPLVLAKSTENIMESHLDFEPLASKSVIEKKPVETNEIITQEKKRDSVEVVVKKGDYLDKIARANRVSVQEIMTENSMTSTRLKIGQVLKIPLKELEEVASVQSSEKKSNSSKVKYYTVQSGDTLWYIATKNDMQVGELLKINGLNEDSARRLQPGDTLKIY